MAVGRVFLEQGVFGDALRETLGLEALGVGVLPEAAGLRETVNGPFELTNVGSAARCHFDKPSGLLHIDSSIDGRV